MVLAIYFTIKHVYKKVMSNGANTMKEVTKRQGFKWVKITHIDRNSYVVAFGFKGNFKATKVLKGTLIWSEVAAENWLKDQ